MPLSRSKGPLALLKRFSGRTIYDKQLLMARTTILRVRKKPNGDNRSKQDLEIRHLNLSTSPEFIDMYNHFMNGVDRADQRRTYYRTNWRNYRTWRPLWN